MTQKIKFVCSGCGGDAILRDAYATWDVEKQDWVLHAVYDTVICRGACDDETFVDEVPA